MDSFALKRINSTILSQKYPEQSILLIQIYYMTWMEP